MKIPFGLHIIRFDGGLGNQMFEYAFYLSLCHKHPFALYGFDTYASDVEHYGYELDKIFHINSSRERKRHAFLRKLERHHYVTFTEKKEKEFWKFDAMMFAERWQPHVYVGYFQTEKYFAPILQKIRKAFTFRKELLSEKTRLLAESIKDKQAISLHIRRGDYLGIPSMHTIDMSYYDSAVELLRTMHGGGQLLVFADDPEWAKENVNIPNRVVVDWNIGDNSWQDMFLMTQCKHNIIANSSFSWWGAWLNSNPNKIVIAPKKWREDEIESDIIPETWIRL